MHTYLAYCNFEVFIFLLLFYLFYFLFFHTLSLNPGYLMLYGAARKMLICGIVAVLNQCCPSSNDNIFSCCFFGLSRVMPNSFLHYRKCINVAEILRFASSLPSRIPGIEYLMVK